MPLSNIENIKKLVAVDYPEVASFRCVEVTIPDDDKYLYALAGFISLLGNAWSYTGERSDRIYRAARWRMAYSLTTWAACMNCEELQECLQPLFDALRQQVNQDAVFREFGTENPVGAPLPEEVLTAPLAPGSNPTCDLDILWSQCEQLVDYSNVMITDFLEQFETATNNIEFAQVITSLPILDELGSDAIAGYVELVLDGIAENYAAEYDTFYRNTLACEIFCRCQGDCEITIERVYDIMFARVVAHFGSPGETLSSIGNLLSYLVDQDIDGDVIVDTLFFLLWGGAKLINSFIMDVGTTALETILELAVNDANDDWILLCEVCPQCEIEYEVTKGTETDGIGTPAAEEFGVRPTGGGADAYFREIIYEFAEPVISAEFNFAWIGAHDGVFAQLGDGTVVSNTADNTGTLTAEHATGATTLIIVGGYASEPLYETRYPEISDMNGCTSGIP